jgi:hypothetical protein
MGGNTLIQQQPEIEYDYYLKLAELYDTIDLDVPWDWKQQHEDSYMPSSKAIRTGAIAEQRFITECLERNFEPHTPVTPMPWDFIVTCPAGILKVQIKSSQTKSTANTYLVGTASGNTQKNKMCDTIDVVGCYIPPLDTWWLIPRDEIAGKSIKLNPEPSSKGKHKKYQENWSIFYE